MKVFLSLVTLLILSANALSQSGTVRGTLYEQENGEVIPFTYVFLDSTDYGVISNGEGVFVITNIPPGDYTLKVESVAFAFYSQEVSVTADGITTLQVYLEDKGQELKEAVVNAERTERATDVRMSVSSATKKDIQAVPVVGGTKDLMGYITAAVPGAITTGDQGGQVYIRGGSPIQNKVLLDGMVVYNPFHSIGFFSVFDTDIIRTADIYTGGFNAEYGGRISSIMDIKTRDGNKQQFKGKLDANPFMSKLLLEGPLWNNLSEGGSAGTFVLSGKKSYLEQSSRIFYPYVNQDTTATGADTTLGLPFNFNDIYGKFSIAGATGSKVNFFGFYFDDQVNYQAISNFGWNTWGIGSNFVLLPGSSSVLIEGDFSFSDYNISLEEENLEPRTSSINGFNVGFDFTYFMNKKKFDQEVKYGVDLHGFGTDFFTFNSVGRRIQQEQFTTELAGYLTYKYVSTRLVLEPSFRLHYYVSLSTVSPEPRIGIKYNVNEKLRFKGAAGIYSQNFISAVSDRDVVNLFYGFLSGPDNLQEELVRQDGSVKEITHALQKANHYILGFEYDFSDNFTLNLEGYIKHFTQLTNLNRNKIYEETDFDKPEVFRKDFIIETGFARGVDLTLKYQSSRFYVWAIYSLQKIDRWDGVQEYSPVFDRRHNINLVGTVVLGKDGLWEINARWNYGSGFPFTQTSGFFEEQDFNGGIGTDYTATNGNLGTLYGDLNNGRLPHYHRFDLTVTKNFEFYKTEVREDGSEKKKISQKLQLVLGVTNLYDRENVFYVNRVTNETVRQLPILPSLGVNWEF